jgi:hypothetical protein
LSTIKRTGKAVLDSMHDLAGQDGSALTLHIHGNPIYDHAGEVDGAVFKIEDVSEKN